MLSTFILGANIVSALPTSPKQYTKHDAAQKLNATGSYWFFAKMRKYPPTAAFIASDRSNTIKTELVIFSPTKLDKSIINNGVELKIYVTIKVWWRINKYFFIYL